MATRWIETDTLSNQNISSAIAVGAYTSDGDRWIAAQLLADQVTGSGDYMAYLTLQVGGAGSAYVLLPKTTMTAAAGETAIGGQTIYIFVRSGDVVTCYVDGLAGDTTTVDTIVRWAELDMLRPATIDRTVDVDANGKVILQATQTGVTIPTVTTLTNAPSDSAGVTTLLSRIPSALFNGITSLAQWLGLMAGKQTGNSTARTEIRATGAASGTYDETTDSLEALRDRTASQVLNSISGTSLSVTKYADFDETLTGLTISASWTKQYLTVKRNSSDDEADSILQIMVTNPADSTNDGVIYVNGAEATEAQRTLASLTVTQAAGTIAIHQEASLNALLPAGNYTYDRKELTATTAKKIETSAAYSVDWTETQATS